MNRSTDERAALERELLIEQIKFYRAQNEERRRAERERELELFLARHFGYAVPRHGRRSGCST